MSQERRLQPRIVRPAITRLKSDSSPTDRLAEVTRKMDENPDIADYSVKVSKKTGLIKVNAKYTDGRVITQTDLGPGLQQIVRYNPNAGTKEDRDSNILRLLSEGLTQTEVASHLGVSQALVSKVFRESQR